MTKRFIDEGLVNQVATEDKMGTVHEEKSAEGRVESI